MPRVSSLGAKADDRSIPQTHEELSVRCRHAVPCRHGFELVPGRFGSVFFGCDDKYAAHAAFDCLEDVVVGELVWSSGDEHAIPVEKHGFGIDMDACRPGLNIVVG